MSIPFKPFTDPPITNHLPSSNQLLSNFMIEQNVINERVIGFQDNIDAMINISEKLVANMESILKNLSFIEESTSLITTNTIHPPSDDVLIVTRGGKVTKIDPPQPDNTPENTSVPTLKPSENVSIDIPVATPDPSPEQAQDKVPRTRIPYPGRLKKEKQEAQFGKYLDIFKSLHLNVRLLDALVEMPSCAKFFKELLSNKEKLRQIVNLPLDAECSLIVQHGLPPKLGDTGRFTIPCFLQDIQISNALADLGASVNLMPYSLYKKLGLNDLLPTRMTIQLADRSVKLPRGIAEDIMVKVDKFVFPVDFIVMDM